jgi:hypothetical protein
MQNTLCFETMHNSCQKNYDSGNFIYLLFGQFFEADFYVFRMKKNLLKQIIKHFYLRQSSVFIKKDWSIPRVSSKVKLRVVENDYYLCVAAHTCCNTSVATEVLQQK